jgi:O-antigen ligase
MNFALALAALAAGLPLYLVRFSVAVPGVGRLPSTLLEVLLLGIFAVWLWQRGRRAEAWRPLRPWLGPLALFLGAAAVSVLVSPDWRGALGLLRAYFIEPVLFFALLLDTLTVERRKASDQLLTALAALTVVIGVIAVFQKLTGFGIPNPTWAAAATRRVTAFYGFPNAIGLFVAPLVVLFAAQTWHAVEAAGRDVRRACRTAALPAVAALAGTVAAVFAVSQGAMLGMGCGLFAYALTQRRLRLPALAVAAVALAAVLAIPAARTEAVALVTLSDDSGSVRQGIWRETAAMLIDRPIFGAGLSGFQSTFAPYHKIPGVEIFMYPHSWPLNFWVETGLAGLAAFVWIIVVFFRRAFRHPGPASGRVRLAGGESRGLDKVWLPLAAACAMLALLIHGLVDVPYFKNDLALLFWVVVALGTADVTHREA